MGIFMTNDDALHPLVRQMIHEGTRDKPLTLNWAPVERHAYDCLGLRDLGKLRNEARTQIIAEALAGGTRFISYSRRKDFYTESQRYFRSTFTFQALVPVIDYLATDPPPLKWSDLRYVFDIQEDCNGKEAIQA